MVASPCKKTRPAQDCQGEERIAAVRPIVPKGLRYTGRTPSGSDKCIRFGLRVETGAERTTIVDIFDIIQQVRDTGIHLKEGHVREMRGRWAENARIPVTKLPLACSITQTRGQLTKSLAKA